MGRLMAAKLALFDCDGTLVDSQANICMAMEQAFESASLIPPPRADIRRIVGLSVFEAVSQLLPDADEAARQMLGDRYRQAFFDMRGQGLIEEPLYDGMKDLLISLEQDGWLLGVATGKSDRGLSKCLAHHQISDMFITLQTADRHPSKPHPSMVYQAMADAGTSPENTIMIGDTTYDIEMGLAAGCPTVAVAWGYHSTDEMLEVGAHAVAESMDDLTAILGEHR
jgi:phosphoglycolate phosphatase